MQEKDKIVYDKFIKQRIISQKEPLTRTQNEWVQWLLKKDNRDQIAKIGNLPIIFKEVFKFIKDGNADEG